MEAGTSLLVGLGQVLELGECGGVVLGCVGGKVRNDDVEAFSVVLDDELLVVGDQGVHGSGFVGLVADLTRVVFFDFVDVGSSKDVAEIV